MNYRLTTIFLALALVFLVGIGAAQAAPTSEPAASVPQAAPAGDYDYTNHGTAWVPEIRFKFQQFIPRGWGTVAKIKAAYVGTYQWVHIPIAYPSRIAGSLMKVKHVEFCARSSAGASTKPVQWDLWSGNAQWYSSAIAWPANNNWNCVWYDDTTPNWHEDLGISVKIYFANSTHTMTLYKAWVRIAP